MEKTVAIFEGMLSRVYRSSAYVKGESNQELARDIELASVNSLILVKEKFKTIFRSE